MHRAPGPCKQSRCMIPRMNNWLPRSPCARMLLAAMLLMSQCVGLAHALSLEPCTLPGVTEIARCGVLELPENPDRPTGRRLPIHVAIVPATNNPTLPDPIVPLMGGPGEDAIGAASVYAAQFAPLRAHRDLLLVDQRGTGRSAALHCDLYSARNDGASLRDLFPVAAVERCARRLRVRADLTQYGYLRFASDLEQVRVALGYGSLNLFAGSYGTRAAAVYLRAYPDSVRTVYLGSVVPIDVAQPLPMARTAQEAFESLLRACAADAACSGAFPNLSIEFDQIIARLTCGVRVPASRGAGRHARPVLLQRGRVAEWFRSRLYRPQSAATLPWLIHRAYLGDWSPIVEGILSDSRSADSDLSLGLLFAITCNEDVRFLDDKEIALQTRDTFLGDYRVREQQAACKPWPKSPLPSDYRNPVHSSVPTMFVSGDTDGATPLWFMRHAAPGFADHIEIVARGQGHTEWSDCIADLYQRFINTGSTHELAGAACEPVPRPPFKTD
jgi:pimeloyl-ACP methyl ester carboxylesterase